MAVVVADTSALVSLAACEDILGMLVDEYELLVPREVVEELEETASYDDGQARAAKEALEHVEGGEAEVHDTELDSSFPLDIGENAAVTLADSEDADIFVCDEFNSIGLVHASLSGARLVTTPKLLEVFVHEGRIQRSDAVEALDRMSELRSWENNSYVGRVREVLEE